MFKSSLFCLALVFSTFLYSADGSWTLSSNGLWRINGNWSGATYPGFVPAPAETATFNTAEAPPNIITLTGGLTLSEMDFQDSGYTITGGTITVTTITQTATPAPANTIASDVVLGTSTANIGGGANDTLTISGDISGTSLAKTGAGTLRLSGTSNSWTGATTLSAGTLNLQENVNLGSNSALTMSGTASLTCTGSSEKAIGTLTGVSGNTITLGSSDLSIAQSSNATFAGVISGSGDVSKSGTGNLTLSGTNTYTGSTNVSGTGELVVSGSIASASINVSEGTLNLSASSPVPTTSTIALTSSGVISLGASATVGTITAASASNTVSTGGNTLTLSPVGSHTFAGVIQGTGAVIKDGAGVVTLSADNTYTGNTTVQGGTLAIGTGGSGSIDSTIINVNNTAILGLGSASPVPTGSQITLANTASLNVTTSATIGALSGGSTNTGTLSPGATLTVTETGTNTFAGVLSGAGALRKEGAGTLTLSGNNTYTGPTTVGDGTLQISGSVDSANINVTSGTLTLSSATPVTTSSTIALTGNGGLIVDSSSVTVGSLTGAGSLNIVTTGGNTLVINPSSSNTYNGIIQGTGGVTKAGTNTLTFSGTNTYTGNTLVNAGTLVVTGSIASGSTTTVGSSGTLKGTGSTGSITNQGIVAPGLSIGTITITGNYTQDPGGTLEIEINPSGSSDLLDISGTATLSGTLQILPESGTYTAGTVYTIITADLGVSGDFTSVVETHAEDFTVTVLATSVTLTVDSTITVIPVSISNLRGNSKSVADYLYANSFSANDADLSNAISNLTNLSAALFPKGLIKVSPVIYGALPIVNLQNDIRIANTVSSQFKQSCVLNKKEQNSNCPKNESYNQLWLDPIGIYYNQHTSQGRLTDVGQPAFTAYTYGLSGGYGLTCGRHIITSLGLGFTNTNIFWEEALGLGSWQSLYIAPSINWEGGHYFWNALLLTSFNFYKMDRNIHYSTIDRTASNHHNSYDLLLQVEGGLTSQINKSSYYLQPEGQFNYLTVFEEGYKESGADSLNLQVRNKTSTFFQPNFKLRLLRIINQNKKCLTPSLYVGWLANIPVSNGIYVSRFCKEGTNRRHFSTQTYKETTNQINLGADISYETCKGFSLTGNYDVNFLSLYQLHQVKLKIQWDF